MRTERVRSLVASRKISVDEGDCLLAAMHEPSRPAWQSMLLNPFDRLGGGPAAAIGPDATLTIIDRMNHALKNATLHDDSQNAAYTDPKLPLNRELVDALENFVVE